MNNGKTFGERPTSLTKGLVLFFVFFACALGSRVPLASAEEQFEVIFVKGEVSFSSDGSKFHPVQRGTILRNGSYLKTLEQSFAIVNFHSRSKIKVNENSLLQLQEATIENQKLKKSSLFLKFGGLLVDFATKLEPGELVIGTPTFYSSIRGTKFYLGTDLPQGGSTGGALAVFEGQVEIASRQTQQKVLVADGRAVTVNPTTGAISAPEHYPWMDKLSTKFEEGGEEESSNSEYKNYLKSVFSTACQRNGSADACTFVVIQYPEQDKAKNKADLMNTCKGGSSFSCYQLGKDPSMAGSEKFLATLTPKGGAPDKGDAEGMKRACADKNLASCFTLGSVSGGQDEYHNDLQAKEYTGYKESLFRILAQHCGKNETMACSTMTYLANNRAGQIPEGNLKESERGGGAFPKTATTDGGGNVDDGNKSFDCLYENVPNIVHYKVKQGETEVAPLCSGYARCLVGKNYELVLLACPAKGAECPEATECAQNDDVFLTFPNNAKKLKLWGGPGL